MREACAPGWEEGETAAAGSGQFWILDWNRSDRVNRRKQRDRSCRFCPNQPSKIQNPECGRPSDGPSARHAHRESAGHAAQHLGQRFGCRLCEFQFVRCDLGVHQDRPQVVDDRPRMGYQVVNMLGHDHLGHGRPECRAVYYSLDSGRCHPSAWQAGSFEERGNPMPADLSLDQESSAALNSTAVRGTTTAGVPVVRRGTVRSGVGSGVRGQFRQGRLCLS